MYLYGTNINFSATTNLELGMRDGGEFPAFRPQSIKFQLKVK